MAWTYSGDPSSSNRDEVRFLCGDTDTNDQLLSDDEIDYCISDCSNNKQAAAMACEAIAAEYARDVDMQNGPAREWASQRVKQYRERAADLRKRASAYAKPVFGGQSLADKDTLNSNSDVPQPYFRRGMSDMAGSISHIDGGDSDEDLS